jgi:hypothetical protein
MSEERVKRNCIRRKKFLNDCACVIKGTLLFISVAHGEKPDHFACQRDAVAHAEAIDAACWSPRTHLSSDSYQRLMHLKTEELCQTLLKRAFSPDELSMLKTVSADVRPVFPLPVVAQPSPNFTRTRVDAHTQTT